MSFLDASQNSRNEFEVLWATRKFVSPVESFYFQFRKTFERLPSLRSTFEQLRGISEHLELFLSCRKILTFFVELFFKFFDFNFWYSIWELVRILHILGNYLKLVQISSNFLLFPYYSDILRSFLIFGQSAELHSGNSGKISKNIPENPPYFHRNYFLFLEFPRGSQMCSKSHQSSK